MTLQEFIELNGLTMTADPVTTKPDDLMNDSQMSHYRVSIRRSDQSMSLYYSMGSAHTEPPKLDGVLDCLMLDAASIEHADDLNGWLKEMGYDANKMPHGEFLYQEKAYHSTVKTSRELQDLLGRDAWGILRNEVEAL